MGNTATMEKTIEDSKNMEEFKDTLMKLGFYPLTELLKTYYFEWKELKLNMSFLSSEEEDADTFEKIQKVKRKYTIVKEILQVKRNDFNKKLVHPYR
jgi:hypothetical protein